MYTAPEYFRSEVPEGRSGPWVVEKVQIPERPYDAEQDPRPDAFKFRPGLYTCLRREGQVFMTDLYDEWFTQRSGIREALARGGEVLITGLGLGLVVEAILRPRESQVDRITVVEKSADVVRLVAPHLVSRYPERVEVVCADAFEWQPPAGARFTVGWHDIWPDPHTEINRSEMAQLEERYRPVCDWQGFWPHDYLRALADTG